MHELFHLTFHLAGVGSTSAVKRERERSAVSLFGLSRFSRISIRITDTACSLKCTLKIQIFEWSLDLMAFV